MPKNHLLPLRVNTIDRCDRDWTRLTTERYRIDERTVDVIGSSCTEDCATVNTLLPRVREWINTVLCNTRSRAPLRITKHLLERAKQYEGAPSRCGTYVELHGDERKLIEELTQTVKPSSKYKIVELGLNEDGNVCKIALLLPFDQWLHNGTERKLFLLIGCDGGLKTFYAVPNFKHRKQYRMDEGIEPLSLEKLRDRVGTQQRGNKGLVTDKDGWTTVKH